MSDELFRQKAFTDARYNLSSLTLGRDPDAGGLVTLP